MEEEFWAKTILGDLTSRMHDDFGMFLAYGATPYSRNKKVSFGSWKCWIKNLNITRLNQIVNNNADISYSDNGYVILKYILKDAKDAKDLCLIISQTHPLAEDLLVRYSTICGCLVHTKNYVVLTEKVCNHINSFFDIPVLIDKNYNDKSPVLTSLKGYIKHKKKSIENLYQKESLPPYKFLQNHSLINIENCDFMQTQVQGISNIDVKRIKGMLIGVAVGDALGASTESMLPEKRYEKYGEITNYIKKNGKIVSYHTDDTQLTFWTLNSLLRNNGFVPEDIADSIAFGGKIYGLGGSVKEFLRKYKDSSLWYNAGSNSAGNGAAMRVSSMILPFIKKGGNLYETVAVSTMITHNDPLAIATNISFTYQLWKLLEQKEVPTSQWWLDSFLETFNKFDIPDTYVLRNDKSLDMPIGEYLRSILEDAYDKDLSVRDACNQWYSGAFLLETVPCVLYILMKHGHSFEESIIRSVNDTRDNDTVAAIVGSLLGAYYGVDNIPKHWIDNMSGKISVYDDDKGVLEIVDEAIETFC